MRDNFLLSFLHQMLLIIRCIGKGIIIFIHLQIVVSRSFQIQFYILVPFSLNTSITSFYPIVLNPHLQLLLSKLPIHLCVFFKFFLNCFCYLFLEFFIGSFLHVNSYLLFLKVIFLIQKIKYSFFHPFFLLVINLLFIFIYP